MMQFPLCYCLGVIAGWFVDMFGLLTSVMPYLVSFDVDKGFVADECLGN